MRPRILLDSISAAFCTLVSDSNIFMGLTIAFSTADFLSDGSMMFSTKVFTGSYQSDFAQTLYLPWMQTEIIGSADEAAISTGVWVLSARAVT